jgi:hypothetical protein
MSPKPLLITLVCCSCLVVRANEPALPHFRTVEIDSHIEIGYGVTVADVDGDGKPDILLADKKQIVWYRNPTWEKFVIAENLTVLDDVCIAAADVDGDGKAEIAVGAGWNPGDTVNSGAVFYLIPPADRTQRWDPVELVHEPTVHRMRWMQTGPRQWDLVVAPLHGRGNKAGEGNGVRILAYHKPADPRQPWDTEVINGSLHMTHNFDLSKRAGSPNGGMLVAAKEGVFKVTRQGSNWTTSQLVGPAPARTNFNGAGEIRAGQLPGKVPFLVTVEPMHGDQLAVYTPPGTTGVDHFWKRHLLDDTIKEGHALACGDLLGNGADQIVIGWRSKNASGKVGIKVFVPLDSTGEGWANQVVDDNTMACEDLCLADLNGDGRLDIIASGRATKNLRIYFNEGVK